MKLTVAKNLFAKQQNNAFMNLNKFVNNPISNLSILYTTETNLIKLGSSTPADHTKNLQIYIFFIRRKT